MQHFFAAYGWVSIDTGRRGEVRVLALAKRMLSPSFWHRAVAIHGFKGVARAGLRSLRPRRPEPQSVRYLDLSDLTDDPVEATYLVTEAGLTPLVLYPIERLRVEDLGLRVDDTGANPYTKTVAEYLWGEHTDPDGSALQQHLLSWRPQTVADFLGLSRPAPDALLAQPVVPGLLPWTRPPSVEDIADSRSADERSWALRFGPAAEGSHGSSMFGPASDAVVRYRFDKHVKVADSIRAEGMGADRSDPRWWDPERGGFIEIQLLLDGDSSVGIVREGKHRSTALAALGTDRVLVSMPATYPVVRRNEVGSWPGVRAGVFTVDQALSVFDRFMEGSPPWGVESWADGLVAGYA